jgi:hypothetical protein
MTSHNENSESVPTRARIGRFLFSVVKWISIAAIGLFSIIITIAFSGYSLPFDIPDTNVSHQKPFADAVGREYRTTGAVIAHAWNDFPDKAKILVISLMPAPGASNRFVSYRIPLQRDQRIRIDSAWRSFGFFWPSYYYTVSVPSAGLPTGIPIKLRVDAEGAPDPLLYKAIDK